MCLQIVMYCMQASCVHTHSPVPLETTYALVCKHIPLVHMAIVNDQHVRDRTPNDHENHTSQPAIKQGLVH